MAKRKPGRPKGAQYGENSMVVSVRFPKELYEYLGTLAEKEFRSTNSVVVQALAEYAERHGWGR